MDSGTYAVLTGDIVASGKLGEKIEKALEEIKGALKALPELAADQGEVIETSRIFRGDSFQAIFSRPGQAIRASLLIKARLMTCKPQTDVRQALGFGSVSRFVAGHVEESSGDAFCWSGTALDGMRKGQRIAFSTRGIHEHGVAAIGTLVDALVSRWTPAQARVIPRWALGKTQITIAKELKISQPAVGNLLAKAGMHAIAEAVDAIDKMFAGEGSLS